jgi:hypothetical protein
LGFGEKSAGDEAMKNRKGATDSEVYLLRAGVYGQLLGYMTLGAIIAINDAPDFFDRVDIWNLLWPLGVVAIFSLLKIDLRMVRILPAWFNVAGVLVISGATLTISAIGVWYYFDIPLGFLDLGWRMSRAIALSTFAIFLIAFLINIVLSVRTIRQRSQIRGQK